MNSLRLLEQHVRPDFRKAVAFGLLALAALITGTQVGGVTSPSLRSRLIAYGCALVIAVAGFIASRTAAREVHRVSLARAGTSAASPLRLMTLLGGYLLTLFTVLDMVGVGLERFLVGGAVTGVILGLAAQPVLGNLFAGLVLMFARPYVPGQQIRVMSGAINGLLTGVIVSAGLLYTVLDTEDGPLNIPNSVLMGSAVGPAPVESDPEPEQEPAAPDSPPPAGAAAAAVA
ncbi:mechanosensitive ion channel family protein [Actinoplanes sp. TFC3]|uniref:mechanosensitive ion channel domain-containing protein n=1 Tax=Actinoplanes sp. TFC3 TaxID=1710355 RepID=UPI000A58D491|nr:mechanosensitive ion channel family protein [Actinoplanes sp. TFC3]